MQYFKVILFVCAFALVNPTSAWCMGNKKSFETFDNPVIPNEIWVHIVSYLKTDAVKNLMFLSKEFHTLIKETTRSLKISNKIPPNELHDLLSSYSNLNALDLSNRNQTTSEDIGYFSMLNNLRHLNLSRSNITNEGLSQLNNLTKLKQLDLAFCKNMTDEDLEQLNNLTNLEVLYLRSCKIITDQGLSPLRDFTKLKRLDLSFCPNIEDAGLGHIANLTNLEVLYLRSCKKITDAGLGKITNLTNLEVLALYDCSQITDEGLQQLSQLARCEIIR